MDNFRKSLKSLIGLEAVSTFALRAGVSEGTLRNLLKGGDPKLSSALRIAKAGDTTLGAMLEGVVNNSFDMVREGKPKTYAAFDVGKQIPLYKSKAASEGDLARHEECDMSTLSFPKSWFERRNLNASDLFAIDVEGDSMEPLIPNGSVVLCDKTDITPANNKIYVFDFDGDILIKQVVRGNNGYIAVSKNTSAYPNPLTIDQSARNKIIGRARHALPDIKL